MVKEEILKYVSEKITQRVISAKNANPTITISESISMAIQEADKMDGVMFLVFENNVSDKPRCGYCGQIVVNREIALFKGMTTALNLVWQWCKQKERFEFQRKEIKQFLTTDNIIARFGDWALFGGLVYKTSKGNYGLNMDRCEDFFKNKIQIPTKIWKDPITNELVKSDYKFAHEVPELYNMLDENGNYIANYSKI
jgi:hypothetical protein